MARRTLRMGMVGGGRGAFIGAVHRLAANLDGKIELVAGAFSSDPEKAKLSGADLMIDPARSYGSYEEMAVNEAALSVDERIDFVSIVTPNFMHAKIAQCFLKAGFHVVCDKPMTLSLEQAKALSAVHEQSEQIFALTHNYTGYPMVKEARDIVATGGIGRILKIVAEYPQGWLLDSIEAQGHKQAAWRTDPRRAGPYMLCRGYWDAC